VIAQADLIIGAVNSKTTRSTLNYAGNVGRHTQRRGDCRCGSQLRCAVPRTNTFALNYQTSSYILQLANQGLAALTTNIALQKGLITYQAVAESFDLTYTKIAEALVL
jgi:hypothetical protein